VAGAAALVALAVKGTVGGTWHIAVAGLGASALGIWLAPRAALGSAAPTPDPRGRTAPR
jgi:hypothetical protein